MSKEMINLCEFVLKTAKDAGADDCRVAYSKSRFVDVQYREHKPENVKEATTQGIDIDIYVNGRYSSQNSADLRKDALKAFVVNVVATAKLLEEDPEVLIMDGSLVGYATRGLPHNVIGHLNDRTIAQKSIQEYVEAYKTYLRLYNKLFLPLICNGGQLSLHVPG